MEISMFYI